MPPILMNLKLRTQVGRNWEHLKVQVLILLWHVSATGCREWTAPPPQVGANGPQRSAVVLGVKASVGVMDPNIPLHCCHLKVQAGTLLSQTEGPVSPPHCMLSATLFSWLPFVLTCSERCLSGPIRETELSRLDQKRSQAS